MLFSLNVLFLIHLSRRLVATYQNIAFLINFEFRQRLNNIALVQISRGHKNKNSYYSQLKSISYPFSPFKYVSSKCPVDLCFERNVKHGKNIKLYLLSVGYNSTVMTSREFHAEMVRPLYRHSMPIIMEPLVPNHRKKQLIPERIIEPPARKPDVNIYYCF